MHARPRGPSPGALTATDRGTGVAATASNIRTDRSLLSRLDVGLGHIERALTLVGGVAILTAMVISVVNILGRKLLNMPVPGYVAIMQQLVPIMAFLGLAYCQRLGSHIRMDILVGRLKGRPLWIAEFFGILTVLILAAALVYGSWDHAWRAYTLGDTTDDLGIVTWPVKMVIPVMLTMLILRFLLQLWGYGRASLTGEAEPVAIPLIEDAATQARHEAETVSGLEERDR